MAAVGRSIRRLPAKAGTGPYDIIALKRPSSTCGKLDETGLSFSCFGIAGKVPE